MNFNSLQFLIFLAVVLSFYWILPHKFRWILLLVASYYFYMSWNAWLIFLILGTTIVSYGAAIAINATANKRVKKLLLSIAIIVCLGTLIFFKYFNFLCAEVINFLNLFSLNIHSFALDILLPVGISFYTFQTLSYVIDVYRGKFAPETHFGYYALFVCYFPQLVAGPIESPQNLLPQLRTEHKLNSDDLSAGLRIALCGFFRKCVVSDFCGLYVDSVFSNLGSANSLAIYMAGILFCIQMYCDFAGYSEIASGVARMMGIKLMKNFDRPYLSQSYTEFFRRWHISLNKWFTEYLYIPLGGNRKGKARKIINIFIVFVLCGLWHGANWTYVIWGVYAAFFISLESLLKKPFDKFVSKYKVDVENAAFVLLRRSFMFLIVFVPAALIFRAQSVTDLGLIIIKLFTDVGFGTEYVNAALSQLNISVLEIMQLVLSVVCMCYIYYFGEYDEKNDNRAQLFSITQTRTLYAQKLSVYLYALLAICFCWLTLLSLEGASSFAYFQF